MANAHVLRRPLGTAPRTAPRTASRRPLAAPRPTQGIMRLLDPPLPPLHLKDSVVRELLITAVGFLPIPPVRGHGAQHGAQPMPVWQSHAVRACALAQHGSRRGGGLLNQSRRCGRARQVPGVASTGTIYSARIEWPILQGRGSTGMEIGPAGWRTMQVAHWHDWT